MTSMHLKSPLTINFHHRCLAMLFCALLLAGCATIDRHQGMTIDGIVFQNGTADTIRNIRISVEKNNAFAECSHVYPGDECSTTFILKRYLGYPLRIAWEQGGHSYETNNFFAATPEVVTPEIPATAFIAITGHGTATASLIQAGR